ncbi:MAG TPA: penicillin-binding transpeptidase domain-containing protein [Bdellovibrionota bacterium]|jgi:penicillin-binding protein 2|nr:penicillin-binding transpeptidase domain-containing protein [Bdellovibrionota bacterium]
MTHPKRQLLLLASVWSSTLFFGVNACVAQEIPDIAKARPADQSETARAAAEAEAKARAAEEAAAKAKAAAEAEANSKLPYAERLKRQSIARTFYIKVPNERGKIYGEYYTENGVLKQKLLATILQRGYLTIDFGPIIKETNAVVIYNYVKDKVAWINQTFKRNDFVKEYDALTYFENRRWLPMRVGSMLSDNEIRIFNRTQLIQGVKHLEVPMRYYPEGKLASHVIGAVAIGSGKVKDKDNKTKDDSKWPMHAIRGDIKSIKDNDTKNLKLDELDWLFPPYHGTRGLEAAHNKDLTGEAIIFEYRFDEDGNLTYPLPPFHNGKEIPRSMPGRDMVISLDLRMQDIAEKILEARTRRSGTGKGAMVVIDSETMEIKALASWPTYNPNDFVPVMTTAKQAELDADKNGPLRARAFQEAYPPASVFKIATSFISLASGLVGADDRRYRCLDEITYHADPKIPGSGVTMKNWTKEKGPRGEREPEMTVGDALRRSCNTWFFQAANEMQSRGGAFEKWFHKLMPMLGLGRKSALGFAEESPGNMYVKKVVDGDGKEVLVKRNFALGAEVANISIGQGDLMTTPLQMAQMVARVASSGNDLPEIHLVRVRKDEDDNWVERGPLVDENVNLEPYEAALNEVRLGMWDVVHGASGTGRGANASQDFDVVGKTGSAQWSNKRNVAWFASYAPYYNGTRNYPHKPKYVVVAMQEGNPGREIGGAEHAAPLVGDFFKNRYVLNRMAEHMGTQVGSGVLRALEVAPSEVAQ